MKSINQIYLKVLSDCVGIASVEKTSRGLIYYEAADTPYVVEINPADSLITLKERRLNYAFNIIEKLSYISGVGFYPNIITSYNKNYSRFVESNFIDPGSYGYRISQQLPYIYSLLKRDPQTRQAVVNIYNYLEDNRGDRENTPCTLALNFKVSENGLDMVGYMRSNDAMWGFPYDISQFTFIQEVMARWLEIPIGIYTHVVTSLHLYTDMIEQKEKIINAGLLFNDHVQFKWDLSYKKTGMELQEFWFYENQIRSGKQLSRINFLTESEYLDNALEVIQKHWIRKNATKQEY